MAYSVKNNNELKDILDILKQGDSLYIDSINCLGNSVYDISEILNILHHKEVYLSVSSEIQFDFINNKEVLKNVIYLLNEICELQKYRVRESIKKAREEGKSLGRKKLRTEDLPIVFFENLKDFNDKKLTKVDFAKKCNCSRPTLDKWLKCVESS